MSIVETEYKVDDEEFLVALLRLEAELVETTRMLQKKLQDEKIKALAEKMASLGGDVDY
jgi:hypothetical protein